MAVNNDPIMDLKQKLLDLGIPENTIPDTDIKGWIFNAQRRYSRYEMYLPGDTFETRLYNWLKQFEKEDRLNAIGLVNNIRYITRGELRTLSEFILDLAATLTWESIIDYKIHEKGSIWIDEFNRGIKENVFVAVTDDVGLDYLRRQARRRFSNMEKENFVEYYKMSKEDIDEIGEKISEDKVSQPNRFFLLDQISASGASALRFKEKSGEQVSKGKIELFFNRWRGLIQGKDVYYTPLIASSFVESLLKERLDQLWGSTTGIIGTKIAPIHIVPISEWLVTKSDDNIIINNDSLNLLKKYYNYFIEDKHTLVGDGCLFGFGSVGLSLIIMTNCPNDTFYFLWHDDKDWNPLFPRISHHKHKMDRRLTPDIEKQEDNLERNCKLPITDSILKGYSLVEIKDIFNKIDLAASLNESNDTYNKLMDVLNGNIKKIKSNEFENGLSHIVSMIKNNFLDNKSIEISILNNQKLFSDIEFDDDISNLRLIIPFLSSFGPNYTFPKEGPENAYVVPAIMFPLSSSVPNSNKCSLDYIFTKHADYINNCKVRTEKFLYLPAESPAISFRRLLFLLDNYKNTNNIEYKEICLLPGIDATSLLVTIVLSAIFDVKIRPPIPHNEYGSIIGGNNLILVKQPDIQE